MKNYLKLVHFEVNRFFKMYLIVVGLVIVSQLIGAVVESKEYLKNIKRTLLREQYSFSEYLQEGYQAEPFSQFLNSGWVILSVFMCVVILMLYVFFIWYREWFAKNTFIYRLLTLPTSRLTIYFAKLTAIMLLVFGFIALQIILLPIEHQLVYWIIPADYRIDILLTEAFNFVSLGGLYPSTFIEFILLYGIGLMFVAVLFTAILFERSYRLKGIFFAIVYSVLSCVVFISPVVLHFVSEGYFYPLEILSLLLVTGAIVLGCAIWLATYLLKYKITV